MAGKYLPLTDRLGVLAASGQPSVEFAFAEIAGLVGGLPDSAFRYREWWANGSPSQGAGWGEADWHVDYVNLDRQVVRFARGRVGVNHRPAPKRDRPSTDAMVTLPEAAGPESDIRVRFSWHLMGAVTLAGAGKLIFPELPVCPGIYRMTLTGRSGQTRPQVYVGETDILRRRAGNYRTPGPSQQTNVRLNTALSQHLAAGGVVEFAIATTAEIEVGGATHPLPLTRKSARVLTEHAALALVYLASEYDVLNQDRDLAP